MQDELTHSAELWSARTSGDGRAGVVYAPAKREADTGQPTSVSAITERQIRSHADPSLRTSEITVFLIGKRNKALGKPSPVRQPSGGRRSTAAWDCWTRST